VDTFRRLTPSVLYLAAGALVLGCLGSAIMQASGEWEMGKFFGRFQRGVLTGAIFGLVMLAVEAHRLNRFDADRIDQSGSRFYFLPRAGAVEARRETIIRVGLLWLALGAFIWATGPGTTVSWPLGYGLTALLTYWRLREFEMSNGIELFQERRIWHGWKGPKYFVRNTQPA
jgi:hypothetical protein